MSTLRQAAQSVIEQWGGPDWKVGDIAQIDAVYSALRTALAAPEQEPVAWMHPSRDPHLVSHSAYTYGSASIPLYAAPVDIEALTKERDELLLHLDIQEGSIDAVQAANQRLASERDALQAARYAYATEFALDEEGQPDVGSIHQNIRALKAAAKLALDAALNVYATCDWYGDDGRDAMESLSKAIDTIRKAGVQ